MSGRPLAGVLALPSLIFFLCLLLVFSNVSPHFLSVSNFTNILSAISVIGLLALGGAFVIASGGIDLSSASVMALSGTVVALVAQTISMPAPLFMLLAIAIGALCGSANGALVVLTRAPSFIITLGMLSIARALAYIISHGLPVYGLPEGLTTLGQGKLLGLPCSVLMLSAGATIAFIMLRFTRFGVHTLALGDDQLAATAMGISTGWLRFKLYTLAGAFSGLAGFVFVARTNMGDPAAGEGYQLTAITAVILGGTSLYGGRATMIGTMLGAVCLGVLQNGLNLLAVSTYYQILFVGGVLVAAAWLNRIQQVR
jgi:ribose/xylose/arabinose/galactoside ABC-type transport system permease subunit